MKTNLILSLSSIFLILSLLGASPSSKIYVCPDCGCTDDNRTFDKPGKCPACGMTLIELSEREKTKPVSVAILLFDGAEVIDYSGPWEVFGEAGFEVHTVAETNKPVTGVFGQKLVPDYTFENNPKADILLVPGGSVGKAMDNPRLIKWLQTNAKDAKHVMSVCTGAFLLSRAGLLDGLSATTIMHSLDDLAKASPKTKVVHDQRYVDNGKIITTAGLSSGIDGAFHLVSKIQGKGSTQALALGMEYRWDPESKFARAALADRYLPDFPELRDATLLSYEGDADHWQVEALVSKPASPSALIELIGKKMSNPPHAQGSVKIDSQPTAGSGRAAIGWKFRSDDGGVWTGSADAQPSDEQPGKVKVTVKLVRKNASIAATEQARL
jgi:putative intracellular protease/amidase